MDDLNNSIEPFRQGDNLWINDLPENLDDIAHVKSLILHHVDRIKELPTNIGVLTKFGIHPNSFDMET